jgi:ABC-type multidrug transport system ATPase subunit
MKIELRNISKKFGKNTVLKNISEVFEPSSTVAIIGSNGRGKSTLLKIVSGYLSPDKGEVLYTASGESIVSHQVAHHISYLAPYISFQDDLTISETFNLVSDFRQILLSEDTFMEEFDLDRTKRLADLSTGMKQRFQLGLCFYQKANVILLDEPTSFLDEKWKAKFHKLIQAFRNERLIILSSNDTMEYQDFNRIVDLD